MPSVGRAARAAFIVPVAAAVALSSCGSSSYKPSASARAAFVDARAEALCAVKDKTFASEKALETAYTTSEVAKIGAKDLQWLKSHLETDERLRADISTRFLALCPGSPAATTAAHG